MGYIAVSINGCPCVLFPDLLFWLFSFKVSSDTAGWYRSSYGTDLDLFETAIPVLFGCLYSRGPTVLGPY